MKPTSTAQLLDLIALWIEARPFFVSSITDSHSIPPHILATITAIEPYRSQTIQDAHSFLSLPKPVGIGLTYTIMDTIAIAPFDVWRESVSPLRVKLLWSETMSSADFTDFAYETFHRIAFEDGRWKMICVWDDVARKEGLINLELLRQFKKLA